MSNRRSMRGGGSEWASNGGEVSVEELPGSELEVLAALWNGGPQTAAELRKALEDFRPMAHGSVLTLLKRLADKELVEGACQLTGIPRTLGGRHGTRHEPSHGVVAPAKRGLADGTPGRRLVEPRGNREQDLPYRSCAPSVLDDGKLTQVIVPGSNVVQSVDPETGEELWRVTYEGYSIVPRPIYHAGLVFVSTGFDRATVLAIDPSGGGDVTAVSAKRRRCLYRARCVRNGRSFIPSCSPKTIAS